MNKTKTLSESAFPEENPFMVREAGPEIYTDTPFRAKGITILLCTGGRCRLYLNTGSHDITPGCESIILPGTSIMFMDCSSDLKLSIFCCSEKMFRQASRKLSHDFLSHLSHTPVYQHADDTEKMTLLYFSFMRQIHMDKKNRYRTIIATNMLRSFILNVYDKVQRYEPDVKSRICAGRTEEIYNEFIRTVHGYGLEHHDVGFYADRLCITPRYLSAVTAAIAGESPKQTIAAYLIREIKILLTFSELTMQQISDRLHFPDPTHLGRFFKQRTGISPLQYRKNEMAM